MQATKYTKQSPGDLKKSASLFSGPDSSTASAQQHWLAIQCNMVRGTRSGLLFRVDPESRHALVDASWPDPAARREELEAKVLLSAQDHETRLENVPGEADSVPILRLYYPLPASGPAELRFVVVLEMQDRNRAECGTVENLLRWNSEWLKFSLRSGPQHDNSGLADIFSTAVACLDQEEFRTTIMALVTELAERYKCQRVSLGLRKGNRTTVQALSHSARFKHETNLVQAISAAMDEAVELDRIIVYPAIEDTSDTINHAHVQLARQTADAAVATLPLSEHGRIIGALTLERDSGQPFTPADIQQIEQLTAVVAPVLWLRHKDEKSLAVKAWYSLKDNLARLLGPAHIKWKLAVASCCLLLVFFSLARGDWRVAAEAVVEGRVQRTIAAPIDGYIASVEARAGDVVTAGQLIGALDDSELRLQRLKWSTLRQQMISESREAMAQHDRAEVSIINAKIDQADAELELIDEQLSRTKLQAPFDGIIIEGDLSQLLGTPVTRGDILFKVAPLDDYRIVLKVDEQDIAPVEPGQAGKLILASLPELVLDLRIDKTTPVSTPEDGRNFFRVEASLLNTDLELQPGMEGVGKITVGEARLFWIWTRDLGNWLRLQTWTWWR